MNRNSKISSHEETSIRRKPNLQKNRRWHTYTHMHTHIHTHAHSHAHTRTHTHTHTHNHANTNRSSETFMTTWQQLYNNKL